MAPPGRDRRLRARPEVLAYVRDMDDLVIFGRSAAALRATRAALAAFLGDPLGLALDPRATNAHRVRDGFPSLGVRVRPGGLRLRSSTWRRRRAGVAAREREHRRGRLDEATLAASVQSTLAHLGRADTRALRRAWLTRQPPVVW